MQSYFEVVVLLGLAITAITFTISVTSIAKPVREFMSKINPWAEELIHCPFCLSFWVTWPIVLFTEWLPLTEIQVFNFFLTVFSVMGVSALCHYVLLRAYEPVAKEMARRAIMKMNQAPEEYEE